MIGSPIVLTSRPWGYRAELVAGFGGDPPIGLGNTRYDAVVDLLMQIDEPPADLPAPVTP